MIAFQYPPYSGGSGIHRTVKFSRYLPEHSWQPIVLTAHPRAYPQRSDDLDQETPERTLVTRAFALDSARHFAIRRMYLKWMALPDRWFTWWFGAVPAGLSLIRKYRPEVIWSTYPIATAHLIGLTLHRITGIPWVADFRDVMADEGYPKDDRVRRCYLWIEKQAMINAARAVFTTKSMRDMYLARYPEAKCERTMIIQNGYDEVDFSHFAQSPLTQIPSSRPVRMVHAGVIYPEDRDPRPLFEAIARLRRSGYLGPSDFRLDLLATGSDHFFVELAKRVGVGDVVSVLPALPYRDALYHCANSDALLLLQGRPADRAIPAKAFEYLRLGKPILALTSEEGDTAELFRRTGGGTIATLENSVAIEAVLKGFITEVRSGSHPLPDKSEVRRYDRRVQTAELSGCFSDLLYGDSRRLSE